MVVNWNTVPQLPPNLKALGNGFNFCFPNRRGESDGAWGDQAHKTSPSGHNPDDTPGSLPESNDSDNIPELRAIDVDKDLQSPATMDHVINSIIGDYEDRSRLWYIIYRGRIIGDHTGWNWQYYNGSNGHYEHAHFSGKASADSNGNPFNFVAKYADGDDMDEALRKYLKAGEWPFGGQHRTVQGGIPTAFFEKALYDANKRIAELESKIKTLSSTPAKVPTAEEIVDELLSRIPR